MTTLLHRVVVAPPVAAAQPISSTTAPRATLTDRALPWLIAALALPFALLWRTDRG